jgi:hypothetical protein
VNAEERPLVDAGDDERREEIVLPLDVVEEPGAIWEWDGSAWAPRLS